MERKTDDEVILQMLKEGKSQKAIAEHFGVSPPYICKRVKKIVPLPKSLEKLTEKEQKFAITVAKGKTQTQAVMESYEAVSRESAKALGSELMSKPDVQTAVADLIESHMPKTYRIRRIKDHVEHPDPNVSLKGLDMSFKLDGSYPPQKNLNMNLNINASPVDLDKYRTDRPKVESDTPEHIIAEDKDKEETEIEVEEN